MLMRMEIVYYAPREEKTWTVHSSCKLTPEPKARVANTSCGLANFIPVERILFFFTSRPKMPYFRFGVGREWGTFGPMWGKETYFNWTVFREELSKITILTFSLCLENCSLVSAKFSLTISSRNLAFKCTYRVVKVMRSERRGARRYTSTLMNGLPWGPFIPWPNSLPVFAILTIDGSTYRMYPSRALIHFLKKWRLQKQTAKRRISQNAKFRAHCNIDCSLILRNYSLIYSL